MRIFCLAALCGLSLGVTVVLRNKAVASLTDSSLGTVGMVEYMSDRTLKVAVKIPDSALVGGAACYSGGLQYHIHTKAGLAGVKKNQTDCGAGNTGGHWDPTLACGPLTGNSLCRGKGGCVNASSADPMAMGAYKCNSTYYMKNQYTCEVGDWSGKFGYLQKAGDNWFNATSVDKFGPRPEQLVNKSIVFHCTDGKRTLCTQFKMVTESNERFDYAPEYKTYHSKFGDQGMVLINNNLVTVDVNLTGMTLAAGCTSGGLKYHIHEKWAYGDSAMRTGASQCGPTYTGGHWDPTIGCSGSTGSPYCSVKGGCVNGSSAGMTGSYDCKPSTYSKNPYVCEVSDYSAKFGLLPVSNMMAARVDYDAYPVPTDLLQGKSMVFHCNDGSRAFCAPINPGLPMGGNLKAVAEFNVSGIVGKVTYKKDRSIMVDLDVAGLNQADLPTGTGCLTNGAQWHTHTGQKAVPVMGVVSSSACGAGQTGGHYDPTLACGGATGNKYCLNKGGCVNGTGYACNPSNYAMNPYRCEVGDLSGKFGHISVVNNKMMLASTVDKYGPPVHSMDGQAMVFHCNSGTRAFCAPLTFRMDRSSATAPSYTISAYSSSFTNNIGSVVFQNNQVTANLDTSLIANLPACASSGLYMRIHTEFPAGGATSFGDTNCRDRIVGGTWDPTVACSADSGNQYCMSNSGCVPAASASMMGSSYMCNSSTYMMNPYVCEAGDMAGKLGPMMVGGDGKTISFTKTDAYPIPTAQLAGKSVVFYCNDNTRVMCAPISAGGPQTPGSGALARHVSFVTVVLTLLTVMVSVVW